MWGHTASPLKLTNTGNRESGKLLRQEESVSGLPDRVQMDPVVIEPIRVPRRAAGPFVV